MHLAHALSGRSPNLRLDEHRSFPIKSRGQTAHLRYGEQMARHVQDHSQSVAIAEIAFEHIKRLNLSAEPSSYELWYAYTTGHNPALNQAIDACLARNGTISDAEMSELRRRYVWRDNLADRLGIIGEKLGDEVEQVVGMIEAAIGVATGLDDDLNASSGRLALPVDRETLRGIVEAVVSAVKEMQHENQKLGHNLKESRDDISKLQEDLVSVRIESLTDPLTGLANRRHLDQTLSDAVIESGRTGKLLSLILADVDNFKVFNDRHGHQLGDHVLRLIAAALKKSVKDNDIVARYGGEEFAIVLFDTDPRQAMSVAENLRRIVAANEIIKRPTGERLGAITLSIGVAFLHADTTAQALIEVADACLYAAKRNGRNCVVCETDPNVEPGSAT
jgi:diguanylate cyclase